MIGKSIRILNVDDHEIPRYVHEETLRREGFEVVSVATGAEALAAARESIDIVILDVQLPDLDGFEVCRRLKADPATASAMVLLTSATFVTAQHKIVGLDSGADGYLFQPFEAAELHATLRSLLRMRAAERRAQALAAELRASVEVRDNFVAMLGHELRNPLGIISTAIHMMERRRDPESFARYLGILRRQAGNLSHIVQDILDVARITSGKIALDREVVDLREVTASCVHSQEDAVESSGHIVELDLALSPVLVIGDEVRLEQVACNLLTNALKYSPAGGHVRVRVAIVDGRAQLEVSDDGIGMDAALRDQVFDVFVQGKQSVDRAPGGLGLGLTVVRQLVELHEGTAAAFSEGEGKGSRFVVDFPLAAAEATVTPAPTRAPPSAPGLRVVVIEDDDDARLLLEQALSDLHHRVEVASDGVAGLELVMSSRPDVAIIDIGLPRLDGYEVARRIRARCEGAGPRLIAMTGYGQPADRERAESAGFDIHVVKPISIRDLQIILVGPG